MRSPTTRHHWKAMLLCSIVLASCAHAPRVAEETESMLAIRNGYLESHPEGRFNAYIARGEVVQGMDFMDVLAAWGIPVTRARDAHGIEYWLYLAVDNDSGDWVRYTFLFERYTLIDWEITRHTSMNGALVYREPRSVSPPLPQPDSPVGSSVSALKR